MSNEFTSMTNLGFALRGFSRETIETVEHLVDDGVACNIDTARQIESRGRGLTKRQTISNKAQSSRDAAKSYGGKALTGSQKQKNWAEHIRREFINSQSDKDVVRTIVSSPHCHAAKFWIENRNNFDKLAQMAREHLAAS